MELGNTGIGLRGLDINGAVVSGLNAQNAVRYQFYNTFNNTALGTAGAVVGELEAAGDTGNVPTIAAGAGAGTAPTVAVAANSTNFSGQVTVTTGTTAATGTLATITFGRAKTAAPFVTLTPGNLAAAAVMAKVYVTSSTTAFVINVGTAALADSTAFIWNFRA